MATEPQSDRQASLAGAGEATATVDFAPRGSDVVVAVMGVTGSGKSTFISKCVTGPAIPAIGHDIESCTQNVGVYKCEYSPDITVYLIDTPGFDDSTRSDKQVLQDVALWLGTTYKKSIRLTGIIYFHRIIDPRMQGSARKNLFMFKKLCGESALKNVILATTMWEKVDDKDGERRESQLISTPDFWGLMIEKGSQVRRHYNTRDSAMDILRIFVDARTQVALDIQCEMVDAHKTLDQTGAGKMLDSALAAERDKFRREIAELHAEWKEAMATRDNEAAEMIRTAQADMERKIAEVEHDRANLKLTLEAMEAHRGRVGNLEQMIADMNAKNRDLEEKIKQLAIGKEPEAAGQSINSPSARLATTYQHRGQLDEAEDKVGANNHDTGTSMANLAPTFQSYCQLRLVQEIEFEDDYGLNLNRSSLYSSAISPDGRRFAAAIERYVDGERKWQIKFWEANGQGQFQQVQEINFEEFMPFLVCFWPGGRRLASSGIFSYGRGNSEIRIWEADRQGQFQEVQRSKCRLGTFISCFSPDGRRYCARRRADPFFTSTEGIMVGETDWQGPHGTVQCIELEVGLKLDCFAFSPDSQRFAAIIARFGSTDKDIGAKQIKIWEVDRQGKFQQVQEIELEDGLIFKGFAFSPDGRRFAATVFRLNGYKWHIKVWEADRQCQLRLVQEIGLEGKLGYSLSAFSPDGRRFAAPIMRNGSYGRGNSEIKIWEANRQGQFQQVQEIELEGGTIVLDSFFWLDSQRFVSRTCNRDSGRGQLKIWKTDR